MLNIKHAYLWPSPSWLLECGDSKRKNVLPQTRLTAEGVNEREVLRNVPDCTCGIRKNFFFPHEPELATIAQEGVCFWRICFPFNLHVTFRTPVRRGGGVRETAVTAEFLGLNRFRRSSVLAVFLYLLTLPISEMLRRHLTGFPFLDVSSADTPLADPGGGEWILPLVLPAGGSLSSFRVWPFVPAVLSPNHFSLIIP